jgi:hypothetical protein
MIVKDHSLILYIYVQVSACSEIVLMLTIFEVFPMLQKNRGYLHSNCYGISPCNYDHIFHEKNNLTHCVIISKLTRIFRRQFIVNHI